MVGYGCGEPELIPKIRTAKDGTKYLMRRSIMSGICSVCDKIRDEDNLIIVDFQPCVQDFLCGGCHEERGYPDEEEEFDRIVKRILKKELKKELEKKC